ncbi:MAG UNVERIFIED_CONTAM: UDP-N-acetylmuramate--L-alanine ligase [Rickettsiaceae bacterium]|jgi:UDP-N-acetylmuramate--alanine ligase
MTNCILNKLSYRIHFIGIGGIGMSGIAEIMHNLGYQIQGSDMSANQNTERLGKLGVKIFLGHNAENVKGVDYVVVSSAIKSGNPEVDFAIDNSIPVIKRADMLAELMRFKGTAIGISGSHGKTTTTALTACLFEAANLNPSVINGGIINHKATNAYIGNSEYVIVEADESDATFIKIPVTIATITNIDPEHLDYYGDFENLLKAFKTFILNLPFYGFAVACIDNKNVRDIVSKIVEREIITYGIDSPDANVKAVNIRAGHFSSTFDVDINILHKKSCVIKDITLSTPGVHNVLNALSAIAIGLEMDFDHQIIKNAFQNFQGVKRRFTKVFEHNDALIIDDYAHHPAEVKATLNTAKSVVKNTEGRVISIFQPHKYSRLSNLFEDFVNCFGDADELFIMDVYSAGEKPIENYNTDTLIDAINKKYPDSKVSKITHLPEFENIISKAKKDDLILMMGAGNITYIAYELAELFKQKTKIVA